MPAVTLDVSWATIEQGVAGGDNPLTDAGLAAMVARFRSVHTVRLQHCKLVTDAGIERVAAGCPDLKHLDLGHCIQATDAGIERLAVGCPSLTHLDLSECKQVTDAGVVRLAAGCPSPHTYAGGAQQRRGKRNRIDRH